MRIRQDTLAETKRREAVEISEKAAVQELLRLRSSIPLSPAALSACAGSAGTTLQGGDLLAGATPREAMGKTVVAAVDAEANKQELKALYRQAQAEVRQQVRLELEAVVQQVKTARQDLVQAQGSMADEIATQHALEVAREEATAAKIAAASSAADAKIAAAAKAAEAAAAAAGSREEMEAAIRSKETEVCGLGEVGWVCGGGGNA